MQVDIHKEVKKLAGFGGKALSKAMEVEEILFYLPKPKIWIAFEFPASALLGASVITVYLIDASKLGKGLTFETFFPRFKQTRFARQIAGLVQTLKLWEEGYFDLLGHFEKVIRPYFDTLKIYHSWIPADAENDETYGFLFEAKEMDAMPWWKFLVMLEPYIQNLDLNEEGLIDFEGEHSIFTHGFASDENGKEFLFTLTPVAFRIKRVSPDYPFTAIDGWLKQTVEELGYKPAIDTLLIGSKWKRELDSLLNE